MRPNDLRLVGAWLALWLASPPTRAQDLPVVYALLVTDNLDPKIGPGGLHDVESMERALRAGLGEDRLRITVLKDRDANPTAILDYFQSVPCRPRKDVLLFHYAGHGAIDLATKEHILFMQGKLQRLSRRALINAMKATNPALMVLLTDCCSDELPAAMARAPRLSRSSFGRDRVTPAFRQLFFRTRGVVDITASDDGRPTGQGGDIRGGLFTTAMQNVLVSCAEDEGLTWPQFYPKLKEEMARLRAQYNYLPQTSRAFGLPGSVWGFIPSDTGDGVAISEVHLDSAAERAGLRSGDAIVNANGRAVRSIEELSEQIGSLPAGAPLRLTVSRHGSTMPVVIYRQ